MGPIWLLRGKTELPLLRECERNKTSEISNQLRQIVRFRARHNFLIILMCSGASSRERQFRSGKNKIKTFLFKFALCFQLGPVAENRTVGSGRQKVRSSQRKHMRSAALSNGLHRRARVSTCGPVFLTAHHLYGYFALTYLLLPWLQVSEIREPNDLPWRFNSSYVPPPNAHAIHKHRCQCSVGG